MNNSNEKNVLIVDDSKSARFALKKFLESHGYRVSAAESADECYALLRDLRPDLIFMDHLMPGVDGFEVLRTLRKQQQGDSIMILTARGGELDRVVGYGVAVHEGQLFGPLNQALGVFTALSLVGLAVSGYVMWWTRRPDGKLGAPPALPEGRVGTGLGVLILALALFLPLLGASLIAIALFEWLVLRRLRPVSVWLGLRTAPLRSTG